MKTRQQIIAIVIAYSIVIYTISFIIICLDPYWYDNSPYPEYISWYDRWGWALVVALVYLRWSLPLLLIAIGWVLYRARQNFH